jgi:hypothetical protein
MLAKGCEFSTRSPVLQVGGCLALALQVQKKPKKSHTLFQEKLYFV